MGVLELVGSVEVAKKRWCFLRGFDYGTIVLETCVVAVMTAGRTAHTVMAPCHPI